MKVKITFNLVMAIIIGLFLIISCSTPNGGSSGGGGDSGGGGGASTRTLNLTVNYTGAGTVDATHKITVGLRYVADSSTWGAPDITTTSDTNNSVITLNPTSSPCYITSNYDINTSGGPNGGDPYTIYNNKLAGGIADPINIPEGGTVSLTITYNDANTL